MAVAAPSFLSILLLLASVGGTSTNDLLSLVDALDYFQARKIEVKAETMLGLASKEPADTKAQIQQLLAIRWLGENPDQAKTVRNARETLRQIAEGEKAQGRLGFAQKYAKRSLAALDGKPAPEPRAVPNNSLRADALRWFPKDATMVGGYDLRAAGGIKPLDEARLRKLVAGMVPPREKEQAYAFIEKLGNVHLDRYSMAMYLDPQQPEKMRMVMRLTGLADRKALTKTIMDGMKQARTVPVRGTGNESITLITSDKEDTALALIGTRDLLVAVATPGQSARELAEDALAARAGKSANVLKGPLADRLQKVPARAAGMFVGDFSDKLRQSMVGRGSPFRVAPVRITAFMAREEDVVLRADLTMANADDAKVMEESIAEWKKMGLAVLDKLPPQINPGPDALKALKKTLEGVTVETTEAHVKARALVSQATLDTARGLLEQGFQWFLFPQQRPDRGPPLPVEEEKPVKR